MKLIVITIICGCFLVAFIIYACNRIINKSAGNKVFNSASEIPFNHVGILLGTSKYSSFGPINRYYQYRIDAALELFTNEKIKYIVVSGDNGKNNYNEPEQMRADLIKGGIDSSRIFLDYAGFRTFDSMVRLKKIFGQNKATVISQLFHNQRAIYIGNKIGVDAIGYNAKDVTGKMGYETNLREKLARVKVFVDFIIGTKPKYLGEKVIIPS